jgi:drug/metabolite transporter (DMT)-like permease
VFWLFAVRKGAYVLVDVFLTLGALISAILSIIFYGAEFTFFDGVGFLLLLIAAIVMCSYSAQIKTKISISAMILLVIVAVANGVSDFTKEIFNRELGDKYSASTFNFYTFLFSAVALLFVYSFSKGTDESRKNIKSINGKGLLYIILMSVCLFLNSFFKTLASRELDMTLVAPLSQGVALVLVAVMSAMFFGEKIKTRCIVGVILAITGLMIMNFI